MILKILGRYIGGRVSRVTKAVIDKTANIDGRTLFSMTNYCQYPNIQKQQTHKTTYQPIQSVQI